jgi:glycosyltransferase involved in cell wall biosynthesis
LKKPNLLYLSPVSPTPNGTGLAKRAFNNLKALSDSYHLYLLVMPPGRKDCHLHPEVVRLCRKLKKIPLHPLRDFRLCIEILIKKSMKFLRIRTNFRPQEWDSYSRKRIGRGQKAFSGVDFSVIHVFRMYMIPVLESFLMDFAGSVQVDLDDLESDTRIDIARVCRLNGLVEAAADGERQGKFYREKEQQLLQRFGRIFVGSAQDKDLILSRYGHPRVEVLPNIIEAPESEDCQGMNSSPVRFLICGNFRYYPNLDGLDHFVKRILPTINESAPADFLVDVVGPGLKGKLKRQVKRTRRIMYHGQVPDMSPYVARANAVLVPIRSGGGTRIKILEGFAYGKTVISTLKGAEGLPVEHNRHILLAERAEDFAGHCLRFLADPRRWEQIGENGRTLVSTLFTPERIKKVLCLPLSDQGPESARRVLDGEPIDVVYTWVDGATEEFSGALNKELIREGLPPARGWSHRYRDNQELRYSLRSLEKHAPWAGHVYLVTNGQVPPWLRLDHPRLSLIDHRSIFPDEGCLPSFNSNAIELCLHRIPGLSKRFLYLNDDQFFGWRSSRSDFITAAGGIRFFQEAVIISKLDAAKSELNRSYIHTQNVLRKIVGKNLHLFLPAHTPQLYDREILERLEHLLEVEFRKTRGNRLRSGHDVVLRILFFYYLLESSGPVPAGHQSVPLGRGSTEFTFWMLDRNFIKSCKIFIHMLVRRPKFFCVNDDVDSAVRIHPLHVLFRLFLRVYFPRRSSFEK